MLIFIVKWGSLALVLSIANAIVNHFFPSET